MTRSSFANALDTSINAADLNSSEIEQYLKAKGTPLNRTTIRCWRKGLKRPGDNFLKFR